MVNLRASERCIVILSQRYGASLKSVGFNDVSATHLEYREAMQCSIPTTLYVRDRLWAEYLLWRKNGEITTVWAQEEDAIRLFSLIEEHARLENTDKPNWVWPFTSANDLCDRVLRDLGGTASTAMVRMLSEQGRLPQFSLGVVIAHGRDMVVFKNSGIVSAMRVTVRDPSGQVVTNSRDFEPGREELFDLRFGVELLSACPGRVPVLQIDYETPTGERLTDLFAVLPGQGAIRFAPAGRLFVGRSLRTTSPEVTVVAGMSTVALAPINKAHEDHML